MRPVWYGADAGPLAVYFHGAPGAPEEIARFDDVARSCGVRLLGLDRGQLGLALSDEERFRALAEAVTAHAAGAPAHLIGFSLGGFVALRTAPHLGRWAASLDLVSAAAPLELGSYLDDMAGKPVFTVGRQSPGMLRLLTAFQGLLAKRAPSRLFALLFASAAGGDAALADEPAFRAEMADTLSRGLNAGRAGYVSDVLAYVQPWAGRLAEVRTPTRIWHGAADTWSPLAMASALAEGLPGQIRPQIAPGLSHYSCLYDAMPQILTRIGRRPRQR